MEKNGKIKKIGCLGAYSFVLFLFAFDCLYFWVSQKRQVVHYNKLYRVFLWQTCYLLVWRIFMGVYIFYPYACCFLYFLEKENTNRCFICIVVCPACGCRDFFL